MHRIAVWKACLLCVVPAAVSARVVRADGVHPHEESRIGHAHATAGPVLVEEGPVEVSTVYATGEQVEVPTHWRHKFVCGTDTTQLTVDDLRQVIEMGRAAEQAETQMLTVAPTLRGGGLNINFNVSGSPPQAALDALQRIANFYAGLFDNPITVAISFNWSNLGSGALGGTSSSYLTPTCTLTRNGLLNNMDADDSVHYFLPEGSSIPVRYNASTATVTNTTSINVTRANYRATVGSAIGTVATMWINSNTSITWDFDESNGIPFSSYAFESVVIHEVGHALGFTSSVDGDEGEMDMMDIFRFQRTDGTGDWNPDTFHEFQVRARTVDFNNLNDDVNSDLITVEYRMSDGDPWQASHFREQGANIGLMDPAIANGQTFWSQGWLKVPDRNVFDAIGWNYVVNPCTTPGDFDNDGDVDLADLREFQLCFAPGVPPAPGCECANVAHEDNRVNLLDWEVFEKALITGP